MMPNDWICDATVLDPYMKEESLTKLLPSTTYSSRRRKRRMRSFGCSNAPRSIEWTTIETQMTPRAALSSVKKSESTFSTIIRFPRSVCPSSLRNPLVIRCGTR